MIRFACSHCKSVLRVSDDKGGHRGKCPRCGEGIEIPLASTGDAPAPAMVTLAPERQAAGQTDPEDSNADTETAPANHTKFVLALIGIVGVVLVGLALWVMHNVNKGPAGVAGGGEVSNNQRVSSVASKEPVPARMPGDDSAKRTGLAPPVSRVASRDLTLDLGNGVSMKLVLIPAGKFLMGSPENEKGRDTGEKQHEVTITKPFYMGVCPVTQDQYEQIVGSNPSASVFFNKGAAKPVTSVSWNDTVEFCKKVSQKTGKTVKLPTEAQWEYACRAGSKTRFCYGDDDTQLGGYARYGQSLLAGTDEVCQRKPNAWGLYDMHGNVLECCSDWLGRSYANAQDKDPTGPAKDENGGRVARGSNWAGDANNCRSANRSRWLPDTGSYFHGFRVVAATDPLTTQVGEPNPDRVSPAGPAVPRDDVEAVMQYRKAAETGDVAGMCNLGTMCAKGRGVPQDDAEALRWFRRAAEAGNAHGMYLLGGMYWQGRGVPKDEALAITWYRKAAGAGDGSAMTMLGTMCSDGIGVPQDNADALRWFRKGC